MSNVVCLLYDIVVHVDHENRMILTRGYPLDAPENCMRKMAHHQIQSP